MFFFGRKVDVLRLFFLCCQRGGQRHIRKHRCPWNATAIKTRIRIMIISVVMPPPRVFWRSIPIIRIGRRIVMIVIRWIIRIRVVGSGLHILRRNNRGSRLCHDWLCCHCCWFRRVRLLHSWFWRCLGLFCWCIRGDSSSGFCSRSGTTSNRNRNRCTRNNRGCLWCKRVIF